jgi:hypothetical protein
LRLREEIDDGSSARLELFAQSAHREVTGFSGMQSRDPWSRGRESFADQDHVGRLIAACSSAPNATTGIDTNPALCIKQFYGRHVFNRVLDGNDMTVAILVGW